MGRHLAGEPDSADGPEDRRRAPDVEERWRQARSVLEGRPDEVTQRRRRRVRTLLWVIVAVVLLAAIAPAVLSVVFSDGHHAAPDISPTPLWRGLLGVSLAVAGLVVEVIGVVKLVRAGGFGSRWRDPSAVLTRTQRRQLLKQVRGQQPPVPARLPLARDLAERLVRNRPLLLIQGGLPLVVVGPLLEGDTPAWVVALLVLSVLLVAAGMGLYLRDLRRARDFLARHPGGGPESPDHPETRHARGSRDGAD